MGRNAAVTLIEFMHHHPVATSITIILCVGLIHDMIATVSWRPRR